MNPQLKALIDARNEIAIIDLIRQDNFVLNDKDQSGASTFMVLAYHGLMDAFQAAVNEKSSFTFHEAIVSGKYSLVESYISKTDLLELKSDDGFTPIALAAFFNQSEIAKLLLYAGADPDVCAANPSEVNALHAAVARGNFDLVKLFLNHNAEVDAAQMQGVTPLMSAVKRGNIELSSLLLKFGADPNLKMDSGESSFDIAKNENNIDVLTLLEKWSSSDPLKEIDKIALIELQDNSILSARSKGKTAFYFPGGKRDPGESDEETLIREMKEELMMDIIPDSIKYIGTFKAQADGHEEGVIVKMTCYSANYKGKLEASQEIAEFKWLTYEDIEEVSFVDKVIFHWLKGRGEF